LIDALIFFIKRYILRVSVAIYIYEAIGYYLIYDGQSLYTKFILFLIFIQPLFQTPCVKVPLSVALCFCFLLLVLGVGEWWFAYLCFLFTK